MIESAQIFRLDEPQYHHLPAVWATRTLDNVHEPCVSPIGSCTIGTRFAQIPCSERDGCLEKCWTAITKRFFGELNLHNVASFRTQSSAKKFGVHTVTLGRPPLCDPNLQSPLFSLRRSSARHSLRLLKTNPRPARPMKEPSVPALPPARKRKRVRPQGRPRAAGPTKAARWIHRIKTTLVPGPIPWLLRKAVADIDIVFGGGCTLREQGPRRNPGPLPFL